MGLALAGAAVVVAAGVNALAQSNMTPTNDLPNPYATVENHFKMPEGRTWGATSAVDIDRDGRSIWVAERCGANSCLDRAKGEMSPLDVVLKFDQSGKLVRSFGVGMMIFPHATATSGSPTARTTCRDAGPASRPTRRCRPRQRR
jgi:hypothetical protein